MSAIPITTDALPSKNSDDDDDNNVSSVCPFEHSSPESYDIAADVSGRPASLRQIELFCSGTTSRISPYNERFESLSDILSKPFTAVYCQTFSAAGIRSMIIEVSSGYDVSQLRLTEVLYSPEVGYTLVSIGRLDELGFSMTFAEGYCTIRGADESPIWRILRTARGLYRVVHEHETAQAATDIIAIMVLH